MSRWSITAMSPAFSRRMRSLVRRSPRAGPWTLTGRAVRAGAATSSARLGARRRACSAPCGPWCAPRATRASSSSAWPRACADSPDAREHPRDLADARVVEHQLRARDGAAARPRPSTTATCPSANAATCGRCVTHNTWCCPPNVASARPTAVPASPPMPASTSSNTRVGGAAESTTRRASIARASSPPEAALARGRADSPGLGASRNVTSSAPSSPAGLGVAGLDDDLERRRRASRAPGDSPAPRPRAGRRPRCGPPTAHARRRPPCAVGVGERGLERGRARVVAFHLRDALARVDRVRLHVGERRAVLAHELAQPRPALLHVGEALRIGDDLLRPRRARRARPRRPRSAARAAGRRSPRTARAARPTRSRRRSRPAPRLRAACTRLRAPRGALPRRRGALPRPRASLPRRRSRSRRRRSRRARSAADRAARARERSSPPIAACSSSTPRRAARASASAARAAAAGSPANVSSSARCSAGSNNDWCACWPCRSTSARPRSVSSAAVASRPSM